MSILYKSDNAPAFNFLFRTLFPVVFVVIISSIFYLTGLEEFNLNIYLVVVYYFLIRFIFILSIGQRLLLNWPLQFAYLVVSIPISYFIYDSFITKKEYLFPDISTLGNELWLLIIVFIYHTLNNISLSEEKSKLRKSNYVKKHYLKFKEKFGSVISEKINDPKIESLLYAIMIYENFNRPKIIRIIESIAFKLGKARTLGIMQITTTVFINDKKSVELAIEKILKDHELAQQNTNYNKEIAQEVEYLENYEIRQKVLKAYNTGQNYHSEISQIQGKIIEEFYSEIKGHYLQVW